MQHVHSCKEPCQDTSPENTTQDEETKMKIYNTQHNFSLKVVVRVHPFFTPEVHFFVATVIFNPFPLHSFMLQHSLYTDHRARSGAPLHTRPWACPGSNNILFELPQKRQDASFMKRAREGGARTHQLEMHVPAQFMWSLAALLSSVLHSCNL